METITRKGKQFPLRTFEIELKSQPAEFADRQSITIAPASLLNILDFDNDEADETIDNEIYFYVDDQHFDKSGEEICKNHLDEEVVFIEEEE
jgi:hypothetical protein